MAKTNRDNLCGAKVCELVSVSHIDFADYHVVMHASSLRAFYPTFNYWATPTGEAQFKIRSFIGVRNGIPMGRLLCFTISLASW